MTEDIQPDPDLTDEQKRIVSILSETDLKEIDDGLLSNAKSRWQKVANIVGKTMIEYSDKFESLPDVFFSQRIRYLVEKGLLENRGDLQYMRYSEVRLPNELH